MKITLSAAVQQLEETFDQIDPETGELPEGFQQVRELVATKAEAVAAYMLNAEHYAEMLKARSAELTKQAKSIEKRSEWLKRYLLENMAAAGMTEIRANDGSFIVKRYPERDAAVEVFEPDLLPDDYLRVIPAKHEPDKTLIKRALGDGFDVPGARVVKKDRLEIR